MEQLQFANSIAQPSFDLFVALGPGGLLALVVGLCFAGVLLVIRRDASRQDKNPMPF